MHFLITPIEDFQYERCYKWDLHPSSYPLRIFLESNRVGMSEEIKYSRNASGLGIDRSWNRH